ncbi:MAG: F0F1 ATP synthase subunit B [Lachnospiraceae bacterium]|nr:F0F1 ATP synthase subunit B [Lachnospiraceae bacterium]
MNRIFGLDAQWLADVCITLLAVFVLFLLLSYLLFDPARELLAKRQAKIQTDLDAAAKDKEDALAFKAEYDAKVHAAEAEVDEILAEGRKKAMKKEADIVAEAKEEAARIAQRASKEIELEKSKMKDEVKKEMISVASMMAGKFVAESMDDKKQAQLVDEALNEIGDDTWRK